MKRGKFKYKIKRYGQNTLRFEDGGEVKPNEETEQVNEEKVVEQEDEVKVEEKSMFDKLVDFFTGGDVGQSVKNNLKKYGDKSITAITIARTPVQKAVTILLNVISNGLFDKIKNKIGHDSFFHLYLIVELDDGKKLRVEKNQTLKISDYKPEKNEETQSVDLRGKVLTLNQMFDSVYNKYGRNRVNIYNALSTNCQRFVSDILQASGILTIKNKKFINQDVKQLADELPENLQKGMKKITDVASYIGKILQFVSRGYLSLKKGGKIKSQKINE